MRGFSIRWMAWYGDSEVTLPLPDYWDIEVAKMANGGEIGEQGIAHAFENPISSQRIRDLAKGKRRAAIAVDDLSRPTQADRLIPLILRELEEAGIQQENIQVFMSTGAHRPMHRVDLIKKLGESVYYSVDIRHHHPHEDILDLGVSSRGTPIHINRLFAEADIKIGVGCILPHVYAGFGGGAKIVLPGLAGIDALERNHRPAARGIKTGLNLIDGNESRQDIEEISRTVGLDLIVNVVVNAQRGVAGCFVGDPVEAHREGIELARKTYRTRIPKEKADVTILNSYPKDTDLIQSSNAFNIFLSTDNGILRQSGAIILICSCPEGTGFHSLSGVRMRLAEKIDRIPYIRELCKDKTLYIFSPHLSKGDVAQYFDVEFECEDLMLFRTWDALLHKFQSRFRKCRAVVFPCSSIQLAEI